MKRLLPAALVAAAMISVPAIAQTAQDPLTRPIQAPSAERWLQPQAPIRIYGNTYAVGFGGLSVVLIKTEAGLILVDAALPQAAPSIEAHIRQLGFRVEDVKLILNTEAHFDHSGGLAALARDSGAVVVASPQGARALRQGRVTASDPQSGAVDDFPPVTRVREIADGGTLRLGKTTVTARFTPGHTPGSTSWTWVSCEGRRCLNVVFGASLNAVSATDFYFSDPAQAKTTAAFRKSIRTFAALPCDILITAHPDHSGGDVRIRQLAAGTAPNPFIEPGACRAYADKYDKVLDARIAKERAAASR